MTDDNCDRAIRLDKLDLSTTAYSGLMPLRAARIHPTLRTQVTITCEPGSLSLVHLAFASL